MIVVMFVVLIFVALSAGASWMLARFLRGYRWPTIAKILVAGLLPLALTVAAILIWHQIEYAAYRASGSHEGFMGPGVGLIYGFPYFVMMAVADIFAAVAGLKRK